jgi:hypothetical protein
MIRSITLAALLFVSAMSTALPPADAHGKPEHGGAFCEVKEYTFEVVATRSGEDVRFATHIKDPALKRVSTGTLKLLVTLADKKQETVTMTASPDGVFTGDAKLPKRGRYRVGINYELPGGKKPLTCSVSVKES